MNPNAKEDEEEEETKYCFNCRRNIPLINHVMHTAYCHRNLKLCLKCDEPFLTSEFEEHLKNAHANISCDVCFEKLEAIDLESHKLNNCPHRMKVCNFCDIDIEASLLQEHVDMCSSRTERCNDCGQFIMLKSTAIHKENHKLKKVPNVSKLKLDESPESLSAYPPLTKKIPNIAVGGTTRSAATRTISMPTLRQHEPVMSSHNVNTSAKRRNHIVSPPVKRNNDQPQINTLNNNDNTNKDPKKNMPIVDIPSDDDDFTVLGAHSLHNNQSVNINNLTKKKYHNFFDGLKGIQLPCEFCQKMIDAENLVLHETGCRPDLATFHNVLHPTNKNTNSQNDRFPVPPLDLDSSSSGSEINLNTLSLSSDDDGDDDDDNSEKTNVEKLPCEFCEKLIPIKKLINHQIVCEKIHLEIPIINNLGKFDMPQPDRQNTNVPKSVNIEQPRRNFFKQTSAPDNPSGRTLVLRNSDSNAQSASSSVYEQQTLLPRVKLHKQNISTDNRFVNSTARKNYEQFLSNSRLNHSDLGPTRDNSLVYLNPSGGAIPKQRNTKSNNNRRVINDLSKRRDSDSSSD